MKRMYKKEILPFELGLQHGVVGKSLEFDNIHNPFYKKIEFNAYKLGYQKGQENCSVNIWREKNNIREILWYLIYTKEIMPIDFKLERYIYQTMIGIEDKE
jgi:hypothetical protein